MAGKKKAPKKKTSKKTARRTTKTTSRNVEETMDESTRTAPSRRKVGPVLPPPEQMDDAAGMLEVSDPLVGAEPAESQAVDLREFAEPEGAVEEFTEDGLTVDGEGSPEPLVEEVKVLPDKVKILCRADLTMSIGRKHRYVFKQGKTYLVPRELAQDLFERGYA